MRMCACSSDTVTLHALVSCSSILSDATKSHLYQHKNVKQMLQQKKKRHKHGHPVRVTMKYRDTKVTRTSEMYPSMVHEHKQQI